jgi:hypothetical protein
MSKTRDTGFLGNVVKYDASGNVTVVNGATTLLSVSSSGQLTVPGDEVITGSLTVLGGITGAITGSATSASYAANTSLLNGSGSGEFVPTGSFNTFSSSILSYTGSANSRLGSLETTSGSNITRINALEVTSGSNITRLSALETASGSAITRLSSLESRTGSYATTGSNTFVDGQYLSSSFNPTGFSTTASLYTDGGLRVTRDAYISGTLYLNNVTVFGTQSVAYISSSQLNIGTNLITVNTDTPSIRFGGLAVYDSGSTGLTGSILWDSETNHWVYSNPSGSSYSGGMFISGPRTSTLGSETGTTSCMLMAGQGGDHITSSMIYHSSTVTCIPTAIVGGSTACFASTITACNAFLQVPSTAAVVDILRLNNPAVASSGTRLKFENGYGDLAAMRVTHMDNGSLADDGQIEFQTAQNAVLSTRMTILNTGNVGINTTTPCAKLDVSYSGTETGVRLVGGGGACCGNIFRSYIADYSDGSPINLFWANHGSPARTNTLIRVHTNETAEGGYPLRITAQGSLCSPTYEALSVDYNGRVGIGTTSPCAKLHIQGTGALQDLLYFCTGGSVNTKFVYSIVSGADDAFVLRRSHTTQGELCIMSWTYNGLVGIGTTTPTGQLHICGSDPAFRIQSTVSGNMQLGQWDSTNNKIQSSGRDFALWGTDAYITTFGTNNTERMRIDACGSIAIGGFSTSGTPGADYRSIEIGRQGNTLTGSPFKSAMYVSANATITAGSTTLTYRNTGTAGQFGLEGSTFFIANAASGTTGCNITWCERMRVTGDGLILACGRTSSIMASSGNIQEWVGLTGVIPNNTGWSLFSITNQYDNLAMDMYVFTDVGSFQTSKHEAVFGYTSSTYTGIGFSSAFCIFRTGTTFNETMTICNLSGSNINSQRIAIRVWGYGVGQNGTGGSNLLTTSCLTRIK